MNTKVNLLSSLDIAFFDTETERDTLTSACAMRNEAFSFSLAIRVKKDSQKEPDSVYITVEVDSPIAKHITLYTVENVPAGRIGYGYSDGWFLRKTPGLYPDRLQALRNNEFTAVAEMTKMLVANINEGLESLDPGVYPITVRLRYKKSGELAAKGTTQIKIIDAELPKLPIKATNWIHYDCIAHFAGAEPMSDAFFDAVRNYVALAVKNGQNMILTPAFTPPLDTPVGEERMTVQLVDIVREDGKYSFDFSMLDKFISLCLECGAEYFEHSHLFSQWGAEHAPKIIVTENGKKKHLFGWHTDSRSEEYREFLKAYLTALKSFLEENGCGKRFFFHISDEPFAKNADAYIAAAKLVAELLGDFEVGDALQEYVFYENGAVKTPIVATNHADAFYGKAEPLWIYYTGEQSNENYPNRLIGMPNERQRVLGAIMYSHGVKGFLHWGFNAHHNLLSRRLVDPRISPDMGGDFSSGTSYLVYPDGMAVEGSLRLLSFRDQMQDLRAMYLCEQLIGRDKALEIIRKHLGEPSFRVFITAEKLLALRAEINEIIEAKLQNKACFDN